MTDTRFRQVFLLLLVAAISIAFVAMIRAFLLTILLAAGTLAAAVFTGMSLPAAAQTQTVPVQMPTGEIVQVTVDVPPGSFTYELLHAGSAQKTSSVREGETMTLRIN